MHLFAAFGTSQFVGENRFLYAIPAEVPFAVRAVVDVV
jgi:hypothetical protein